MWDTSIPKIHLAMERENLEQLPNCPLPQNYGWRFFCPGDEGHWARIEVSAGEADNEAAMMEKFHREFKHPEMLPERMIFLTDGGVPFATATAWFEDGETGHLHYVAVDAAHQGMGLSRPLVSLALRRMAELGHTRARLTTQTLSWVGIKVYHGFGFRPSPFPENDAEGWRLVSEKSGIEFRID